MVYLQAFDGLQVIADVTKNEVVSGDDLANQLTISTRSMAENEGKECRFRACWQQSDRVLGSYGWRIGSTSAESAALDGSMQSMLAQNQRHLETAIRLLTEGEGRMQRAYDKIVTTLEKRIGALEQRITEQAEQLVAHGSDGADLAREQLAADIETRARTQEILLSRVVPMIEAAVAQRLGAGSAGETPPTAAPNGRSVPAPQAGE